VPKATLATLIALHSASSIVHPDVVAQLDSNSDREYLLGSRRHITDTLTIPTLECISIRSIECAHYAPSEVTLCPDLHRRDLTRSVRRVLFNDDSIAESVSGISTLSYRTYVNCHYLITNIVSLK